MNLTSSTSSMCLLQGKTSFFIDDDTIRKGCMYSNIIKTDCPDLLLFFKPPSLCKSKTCKYAVAKDPFQGIWICPSECRGSAGSDCLGRENRIHVAPFDALNRARLSNVESIGNRGSHSSRRLNLYFKHVHVQTRVDRCDSTDPDSRIPSAINW